MSGPRPRHPAAAAAAATRLLVTTWVLGWAPRCCSPRCRSATSTTPPRRSTGTPSRTQDAALRMLNGKVAGIDSLGGVIAERVRLHRLLRDPADGDQPGRPDHPPRGGAGPPGGQPGRPRRPRPPRCSQPCCSPSSRRCSPPWPCSRGWSWSGCRRGTRCSTRPPRAPSGSPSSGSPPSPPRWSSTRAASTPWAWACWSSPTSCAGWATCGWAGSSGSPRSGGRSRPVPSGTQRWWPLLLPLAAFVLLSGLAARVATDRDLGSALVRTSGGSAGAGLALRRPLGPRAAAAPRVRPRLDDGGARGRSDVRFGGPATRRRRGEQSQPRQGDGRRDGFLR